MEALQEFTKEQFLETTDVFEALYKLKDLPFDHERAREFYSEMAKKTAGMGNFKTVYKKYCEQQRMVGKQYFIGNATDFEGQEIELNAGNWRADDDGVRGFLRDEEAFACPHPIMPVMRLTNIDTGIEKLKIAYRKGKNWRSAVIDKKILASNNSIIALADLGIAVTSENSKLLVKYLHEVENINYDVIPEKFSVSRLGWIGNDFSPYVENLEFDGSANFKTFFESVRTVGSAKLWFEAARSIRDERSVPARIALAASFASVLVHPLSLQPFIIHFWGGTETGKAQPLHTKIITPNGSKSMKDIKCGDLVIGGDGKPYPVSGVYPQGSKDVYELTFADGTKTCCCKEHLWNIKTLTRKNHNRDFMVLALEDIMRMPLKKSGYNIRIPVTKPVEYTKTILPIDAYLFGALLGDGCITLKPNAANGTRNIYFNNSETDILQKVNAILKEYSAYLKINKSTTNQYVVCGEGKNVLINKIIALEANKSSNYKNIPKLYLYATIEDRKRLLEGLMDTDGTVSPKGSYKYSTGSKQLATDIKQICQSLGYRAVVRAQDRVGAKYHSAGKIYTRMSVEYTVTIQTNDIIFTSKKHKDKFEHYTATRRPKYKRKYDDLPIINIKHIGREECQCIMVDSKEHTYLCDDFIVTHNTVGLMSAASVWASPKLGEYIHTFNSTAVGQEMSAGFVNSLPLIMDELQIVSDRKKFDEDIYKLCEGVGRSRSNRSLGINRLQSWENCIITSGEMPITGISSGGGAVNRIVEIECGEKLYTDARTVANTVKRNYGWAGKIFVKKLKDTENMKRAATIYAAYYKALSENDTTEKQAMSGAAILTADKLCAEWIFNDEKQLRPSDIAPFLKTKESVSAHVRAYEQICEYIIQNKHMFESSQFNAVWGKIEGDTAYIVRREFDRICGDEGFNSQALLSWLARQGKIELNNDGKYTKPIRINRRTTRCVALCLGSDEDYENSFEEVKLDPQQVFDL